jgi:site-specific DNA recombinase
MKRSLGLARVSTSEQAENSHALEQQSRRLRDAGCNEVRQEVESGASKSRKTLKQVLQEIREGLWQEIVFTRLDRLSRSLTQIREFAETCLECNVNLRFLDQQIDLSTPHGRLMLNMLGSVAEWEVDLLRSRVDAGLKHHRAQKRAPGIVPFGYTRKSDRYCLDYEIYRETGKTRWEVAREIVETFLVVQTIRGTARIMGERYPNNRNTKGGAKFVDFPRENGLKYWLQSPVLRGHLAYYYRTRDKDLEIAPDQHERLISDTEAAEIDRALSIPKRGERQFAEKLPLAGLVYCGLCGKKARASRHHRNNRLVVRWWCSGVHSAPATCEKSPSIRNEVMVAATIETLVKRAEAIALLADSALSETAVEPDKILGLRRSLESLERIPENEHILEAKRKILAQIATLKTLSNEDIRSDEITRAELQKTASDPGFWAFIDDATKRRLFRRFVDKIVIQGGQIIEVRSRV